MAGFDINQLFGSPAFMGGLGLLLDRERPSRGLLEGVGTAGQFGQFGAVSQKAQAEARAKQAEEFGFRGGFVAFNQAVVYPTQNIVFS